MPATNFWGGLQQSVPLGMELGLRSAEGRRADAREARLAKLQEQQGVLTGIETMMKISAIPDKGTRNHLFGLYAERAKTSEGQPIFGPETVATFQKMGDDQRNQLMQVFSSNQDLLGGMAPEQLAEMFKDPFEAMKYVEKLGDVTQQKQKMASQRAGEEAWAKVQGGGDLSSRIASVQQAIQAAGSQGADTSKLTAHLNSLLTEQQRLQTERHQAEQMQISRANLGVAQGNLGVARANMGLRKQELAQGRRPSETEANLDRLTEIESGGEYPRFAAAPLEMKRQVMERGQAMAVERQQPQVLPSAQINELRDLEAGIMRVDTIASRYKPEYTGPVYGTATEWVMDPLGYKSDEEYRWAIGVHSLNNQYISQYMGANVPPSEQVRAQKVLINRSDHPKQVRQKLKVMQEEFQFRQAATRKALRESGYGNLPAAQSPRLAIPKAATAPGVTVEEVE